MHLKQEVKVFTSVRLLSDSKGPLYLLGILYGLLMHFL